MSRRLRFAGVIVTTLLAISQALPITTCPTRCFETPEPAPPAAHSCCEKPVETPAPPHSDTSDCCCGFDSHDVAAPASTLASPAIPSLDLPAIMPIGPESIRIPVKLSNPVTFGTDSSPPADISPAIYASRAPPVICEF